MEVVIEKGYKLFEMDPAGGLHPLFIDKKNVYPIGEWIKAGNYPTKGFPHVLVCIRVRFPLRHG